MRWSAPRSPSSPTRRRRRAGRCSASPSTAQSQIILVDTPGIFQPKRRLDRAMFDRRLEPGRRRRSRGARDRRRTCALARGLDAWLDPCSRRSPPSSGPSSPCSTRSTSWRGPSCCASPTNLGKRHAFERTFMISALNGDGVADLKTYLAEAVPPGPWLYPGRSAHRRAAASGRRRDHPREAVPAAARRAALQPHRRDRRLEGAEGRLRPHRADHLCDAREPAQDRARRQGRDHQGDLHGRARRRSARWSARRCISSCS